MSLQDIVVNGIRVDPVLLEVRHNRRCALGECEADCCTSGVYVFTHEKADILAHQELIKSHLTPERRDAGAWFDGVEIVETDHPDGGTAEGTGVLPDPTHPTGAACVFLRPDRRCALQVASVAAGEHEWRFKPLWCAMHPLVFDEGVLTLAEESEVFRQGGTCSRPDPDSRKPLYRVYEAEARLALGDAGYEELDALATRLHERRGPAAPLPSGPIIPPI